MEIEVQIDKYDVEEAFKEAMTKAALRLDRGFLQLTLIGTSLAWHQRDRVAEMVWKFRFIAGYLNVK